MPCSHNSALVFFFSTHSLYTCFDSMVRCSTLESSDLSYLEHPANFHLVVAISFTSLYPAYELVGFVGEVAE